jgi:hypothetical protein
MGEFFIHFMLRACLQALSREFYGEKALKQAFIGAFQPGQRSVKENFELNGTDTQGFLNHNISILHK